MTITIQEQIIRELARLNMWRDVANDEEIDLETPIAHKRINALLDDWEAQHSVKHSQTQRSNDVECGSST